jgi:transcriptional regulator with PAS, ATPase and Fis domain
MVGESRAIRRVRSLIQAAASSLAPVIITGESGTGKERVAREIHESSSRCSGPFVALNCAAIPDTLAESELFGYERGAFTGAHGRNPGAFGDADGGTILLDEFTELERQMQPKLLRVLEDKSFRRLGGREGSVDVRTLAATNQSPEQAVRERRFRADLYYRLNVLRIDLPPLRKRIEDVPLLVDHFVREIREREHKPVEGVDDNCLEALMAYRWPGNIRELRNVLERAIVMSQSRKLSLRDLPPNFKRREAPASMTIPFGTSRAEADRQFVFGTIAYARGNKARAAAMLALSRRGLYKLLERYEDGAPSWPHNGASHNGRNGTRN